MKKILNYRVIVDKEKLEGEDVYVTQVPTLGISDFGPTLEKALKNTEKMIKFHLECLIEEEGSVPAPDDTKNIFVANQEIEIASKKRFSFT
jgi:predicted RNase H-like HicB family nuclease